MTGRRDTDNAIIADYRTVVRAMDRVVLPLLVERGISMAQFKALMSVTGAGDSGISITELGGALGIRQPSASLLVDQLAKSGYVVRRPDAADRRRVLVGSTRAGEELVNDLRHGRRSTFQAWLDRVGDEDAAAIARGMHVLAKAVQSD